MLNTQINNSEIAPMNIGRLIAMSSASILLCLSMFLSVFTPFPIALASLVYGRKVGLVVSLFSFGVFFALVQYFIGDYFFLIFYSLCLLIGVLLAEVIFRKINPLKGIFVIGSSLIVLSTFLIFSAVQSQDKPFKTLLVENLKEMQPMFDEQKKKIKESGTGETIEIEAMLSDPNLIADEIIRTVPSFFMASIFIILWANTFMLLKSRKLLNKEESGDFNEIDLLKFKMPEQFIFVVIGALLLGLFGDSLGKWYSDIGMTILKTVGVFYFFQGFGIYLAFLDRFNVTGFIRTVLVVLTVLSASYIIAIIGLFDMFVDFNKLLQKKEN